MINFELVEQGYLNLTGAGKIPRDDEIKQLIEGARIIAAEKHKQDVEVAALLKCPKCGEEGTFIELGSGQSRYQCACAKGVGKNNDEAYLNWSNRVYA